MNKIYIIIFLALLINSVANAKPKCIGDDYTKWTNCFGEYTNSKGRIYEGEFGAKAGVRDGYGSSKSSEGNFFVGEFRDDKPVKGKIIYSNGDYFEGTWNETGRYGEGKFFYKKNNQIYTGNFINDQLQGMVLIEDLSPKMNGLKRICKVVDGKIVNEDTDCKTI